VRFSYGPVSLGGAVQISILLPAGTDMDGFWNHGPTPDQPEDHWYPFPFEGTTGAELLADRVVLHLVEGALGDHDLAANGEIRVAGGPTLPAEPPAPPWAILGFRLQDEGSVELRWEGPGLVWIELNDDPPHGEWTELDGPLGGDTWRGFLPEGVTSGWLRLRPD